MLHAILAKINVTGFLYYILFMLLPVSHAVFKPVPIQCICSSLAQDEERLHVVPNTVTNPTLQDMAPSLNNLHMVRSTSCNADLAQLGGSICFMHLYTLQHTCTNVTN